MADFLTTESKCKYYIKGNKKGLNLISVLRERSNYRRLKSTGRNILNLFLIPIRVIIQSCLSIILSIKFIFDMLLNRALRKMEGKISYIWQLFNIWRYLCPSGFHKLSIPSSLNCHMSHFYLTPYSHVISIFLKIWLSELDISFQMWIDQHFWNIAFLFNYLFSCMDCKEIQPVHSEGD